MNYSSTYDPTPIRPTRRECKKSKERYERIWALLCTITNAGNIPTCKAKSKYRWIHLVQTLISYGSYLDCKDPLCAALCLIHWGEYPCKDGKYEWGYHRGTNKGLIVMEIITLLADEIRSPGVGMYEWTFWEPFLATFRWVTDKYSGAGYLGITKMHRCYLRVKTKHTLMLLDKNTYNDDMFLSYESICCTLVSAANTWCDEQWRDERNILQSVDNQYGTDYLNHPNDFDQLMYLLILHRNGLLTKTSSDYQLYGLQQMSLGIAECLCPINTIATVIEKYKELVAWRRKVIRQERKANIASTPFFAGTWIQRQMEEWVYDETIPGRRMKRMVFDAGVFL